MMRIFFRVLRIEDHFNPGLNLPDSMGRGLGWRRSKSESDTPSGGASFRKVIPVQSIKELDKETEFSVNGGALSFDYVGDNKKLAKIVDGVLGDVEKWESDEKEVINNGVTLTFLRRKHRNGSVTAAAKEADRATVEKLFKLAKKPKSETKELDKKLDKETEFPVNGGSLNVDYVGGSKKLVKIVDEVLGDVEKWESDEKEVTNNGVTLTFLRRKNGSCITAAAKEADRAEVEKFFKLAKKFKLEVKELDEETEFSVNGSSLSFDYLGDSKKLAKIVDEVLGDVEKWESDEKEVTNNGVALTFLRRKNGSRITAAAKEADRAEVEKFFKLAKKSKLEVKELDEETEFAVSGSSLNFDYVGGSKKLVKIVDEVLGDVEKWESDEKEVTNNGVALTFLRRKNGSRITAAAKEADRAEVEKFFKLAKKSKLEVKELDNKTEFAVSGSSLNFDYVGNSKKLVKIVDEVLGDVEKWESDEKEVTNNGVTVTFLRRKNGPRITAAAKEIDRAKVEKIFNLKKAFDPLVLAEDLNLVNVISLLGGDPLRCQQFIRIFHPELSEEDVQRITVASINGLGGFNEIKELHQNYSETLLCPEIRTDLEDSHTESNSFVLVGKCDAPFVQITGAYNRKIKVENGVFQIVIPLPKTGEINEFEVYSFNPETEEKSEAVKLNILQTGIKESSEEAFLRLCALKEEVLESVRKDPARFRFLLRSVEQSLLKHFTYNEKEGLKCLKDKIKNEGSQTLKTILEAVCEKFEKISKLNFNLNPDTRLYFFQKYCIYETLSLMEEGKSGVIIANEPGLGKTVTALAIANGMESVILTPNPVVSTWSEQEEKFIPESKLSVLDGPYLEREKSLEHLSKPQVVTNIEFTREMTIKRAQLLSSISKMLIVDEADYLGNPNSQQSQGTEQIISAFKLLLTATPFKRPSQILRLLKFIYPNNPAFNSAKEFSRAFHTSSTEDLNALFLLMNEHTIRIRKKDVFEEYDPNISLSEQSDRLPKKVEVFSEEGTGQFYLSKEQCNSILELFTDYQNWCKKHKASGKISAEDSEYSRFNEGYFSKKEALRQIMSNPESYLGLKIESPKHKAMDNIVFRELGERPNKKVLIFCKYKSQVEAYMKRYAKYNPSAYYGDLKMNADGFKIDDSKNILYYKVDNEGKHILENGNLIPADKETGVPINAYDYERLKFQNDPSSRIVIATYDAGAVGVTLTAADVVIYDDLAPTYRDQYQAGDRAHRIDNDRKKYEVKYYWMQALYPEEFLNELNGDLRAMYFDMGTFDQVHFQNIQKQGRVFHRIMDGVGSDSELKDISYMKSKMPFMFESGDENVTLKEE